MIDHGTFFTERKPAAVMKHGILRHYTKVFTTMLGSRVDEVWVIDAYAGPGEYEGDGTTPAAPGSPRIVCDVADSVSNCTVRGYFIEQDPAQAAQLSGPPVLPVSATPVGATLTGVVQLAAAEVCSRMLTSPVSIQRVLWTMRSMIASA